MEDWYRGVRSRHHVLMADGKPVGGKWNFDHDNRLTLFGPSKTPSCGEIS